MTTTRKYTAKRESWGAIRKFSTKAGDKYQASYVVDGVRYNAEMTYSTKTDARAFLAKTRVQIEQGKWKSPKTVSAETFKTYATTWVEERTVSKPLRPRTRAEYLRFLDKGLSAFADDRLTAITPARVRTWHSKRIKDARRTAAAKDTGATAAAKEAQFLRAILNTAVEDGIIEKNPVPSDLTRTSSGQTFRIPTAEEVATLADAIAPWFRLAVLLAAFGGLRIGEWKALRRRDFTLTEDGRYAVHITRQAQWVPGTGWVVGEPKSAAGVRVQVLHDVVTADVERHLSTFTGDFPESLLWQPQRKSEFIHDSVFRDAWDPAREAAGVKGVVREHDLRHFALTRFAQAGATLKETMAWGGHSTPVAAMRYQHAAADRLADLANLVPALPAPKPKPSNVRSITG